MKEWQTILLGLVPVVSRSGWSTQAHLREAPVPGRIISIEEFGGESQQGFNGNMICNASLTFSYSNRG